MAEYDHLDSSARVSRKSVPRQLTYALGKSWKITVVFDFSLTSHSLDVIHGNKYDIR